MCSSRLIWEGRGFLESVGAVTVRKWPFRLCFLQGTYTLKTIQSLQKHNFIWWRCHWILIGLHCPWSLHNNQHLSVGTCFDWVKALYMSYYPRAYVSITSHCLTSDCRSQRYTCHPLGCRPFNTKHPVIHFVSLTPA